MVQHFCTVVHMSGQGTLSIAVATRHYLASQLMWSALHQARRCEQIEQAQPGPFTQQAYEHTSLAIGAGLSSVAALEALVNEVFADAADDSLSRLEGLNASSIQKLSEYWATQSKKPLIEKAKDALNMSGVGTRTLRSHWQRISHLVDARNALIHFYPETVSQSASSRLEQHMTQYFRRNALASAGSPWFYSGMLGAGYARWAADTAKDFAFAWASAMTITATMEADLAAMPQP